MCNNVCFQVLLLLPSGQKYQQMQLNDKEKMWPVVCRHGDILAHLNYEL